MQTEVKETERKGEYLGLAEDATETVVDLLSVVALEVDEDLLAAVQMRPEEGEREPVFVRDQLDVGVLVLQLGPVPVDERRRLRAVREPTARPRRRPQQITQRVRLHLVLESAFSLPVLRSHSLRTLYAASQIKSTII